jgi:hypothetical protein
MIRGSMSGGDTNMSKEKSIAPEKLVALEAKASESKPPEEIPLPMEAEVLAVGAGYATRLDLDYIFGSKVHCLWAVVSGKSYYKWVNDDQIRTIVQTAFIAPTVSIQYNTGAKQIERVRPIKTF